MKWQNWALLLCLLFAELTEMWKQNGLNRSIMLWGDFWNDFFCCKDKSWTLIILIKYMQEMQKKFAWLLGKRLVYEGPPSRAPNYICLFCVGLFIDKCLPRVIQSNDDLKQYTLNYTWENFKRSVQQFSQSSLHYDTSLSRDFPHLFRFSVSLSMIILV